MSRIPKILRHARSNVRTASRYGVELPKRVVANPSRINLASKYFLEDLPEAITPATRLHNILENLDQGRPLSGQALMYLKQNGYSALQQLAQGEATYEAFRKIATGEQHLRGYEAEAVRQKQEHEKLQRIEEDKVREAIFKAKYERDRQREEEARRKRESDPKFIAKIKNQQLRMRYGLDQFIEKQNFPRLMDILHCLDGGNRLSDEDILWLTTEGKDYYTEILQAAFHKREAEFFTSEYKRTNDPWNVVNASGHYRKCDQPNKAHDLLNKIPSGTKKTAKLNSAICTTHGGVMRDLHRFDEALQYGNQAHTLTPKDFRPCTLLGAVNIEMGNYSAGLEWYEQAKERGASERSIDYDLRGILLRAEKAKREEIKAVLLREDSERYKWVRNLKFKT